MRATLRRCRIGPPDDKEPFPKRSLVKYVATCDRGCPAPERRHAVPARTTQSALPAESAPAAPRRAYDTKTLSAAARTFWRFPTPWVIAALFGATLAARLAVGQWRWWDAVVVMGLV